MRSTAGAGALAAGIGGIAGGSTAAAEGNVDPEAFQRLRVDEETNEIVTEDRETFVLRGLTMLDPKQLQKTRYMRGKTPRQILDLVTDNERGWYPRTIRVMALPAEIGEHPMPHLGPEYEDGELESPGAVPDNRRKAQPPQPPAFDEDQLRTYFEEYYDPIVRRCRERGVYCVVDFHRHWHEQPPGAEGPFYAENHRPYDSEYTNYWAYNTFEGENVSFGTETPASWGWIDQTYVEEGAHDYVGWAGIEELEDVPGTPYAAEHWQVNEDLLAEVQLFWEVAAERYGGMEHVLFEPYFQPAAPGIRGPVEGCGAVKQRPLWDVYLEEFASPILDTIRERAPDTLVLMGTPAWGESLHALHWRTVRDLGYEDVAVSWQNGPLQEVSQLRNWFNDTDYQKYTDIAAETGGELVDPFLPPKESLGQGETEDCWGWESYEAQGLQAVMQYHPVVVTQFGWSDERTGTSDHWTTPPRPAPEHTETYGEPFVEAMEADDRIGWIAFGADVWYADHMFEYDDSDPGVELENDSFHATPLEELPVYCEDLPCEWELLGDGDSGQFLKETLREYADDTVPFETTPTTTPVYAPCEEFGGFEACDPAEDGLYRDLTADGDLTTADVSAFQSRLFEDGVQDNAEAFDFSGTDDGSVSHGDVIALFRDATGL